MGAHLLNRTTRSLALTEEGERYFEQARRLVGEIAEAKASLRSGEQHSRAGCAWPPRWLRSPKRLPQVKSFLAIHPDVKIDLRLSDGFIDLVEQGIDVAVRIGELADSMLVARRIGTTKRALVASRKYLRSLPRGLKAPRAPEDLQRHNCIVYTELATQSAWTFTAGVGAQVTVGTQAPIRAQGNLQTNSSEVVRAAVLSGMGIGFAPTWLFEDEMSQGDLQVLLPDWPAPSMPVHLVSPSQRRHSAKVRALAEHLAAASE